MKTLVSILALSLVASGFAQVTVFDATSATGSYWIQSTGGPPTLTNEEGQNFLMNTSNVSLTSMDIDFVSTAAATNYNDVVLKVTFWDTGVLTYSGSTDPEFTTMIGPTQVFDFGAQALGALGSGYNATGLPITGVTVTGNSFGAQLCWFTDSGNGLVAAPGIQTLKNFSTPAVGSNPYNTYQLTFGADGVTDPTVALLQSQYFYTASTDQNLEVAFSGTPVPEPASLAALAVGALALIRRRRASKP